MSDANSLGIKPETSRIVLTEGADFYCTLTLSSNWPVGTSLTIVFPDLATTWTASISTTNAVFSVDKASTTADAVPDGSRWQLKYINGTTDQTWMLGTVVRVDG